MADASFYPNEKVPIEAFPEDAANLAAPVVPGSFAWSSEPEGIVGLAPSADGSSCVASGIVAGGVIVTCTAVNLAGEVISGLVELDVVEVPAPLATHIRLVVGPASPQ